MRSIHSGVLTLAGVWTGMFFSRAATAGVLNQIFSAGLSRA